jgi:hypothetical protein
MVKWKTKQLVKKIIKVTGKIIFYAVTLLGWLFFGFFTAVAYELFKFLEQ